MQRPQRKHSPQVVADVIHRKEEFYAKFRQETEPERRTWILSFMAGHPNEREALTVHLKFSSTSWQKVQFRKDGGNSGEGEA